MRGLTNGQPTLFIDQYGQKEWARTAKELGFKCGGRPVRMYRDTEGNTYHGGYIVNGRWFTAYQPLNKLIWTYKSRA